MRFLDSWENLRSAYVKNKIFWKKNKTKNSREKKSDFFFRFSEKKFQHFRSRETLIEISIRKPAQTLIEFRENFRSWNVFIFHLCRSQIFPGIQKSHLENQQTIIHSYGGRNVKFGSCWLPFGWLFNYVAYMRHIRWATAFTSLLDWVSTDG